MSDAWTLLENRPGKREVGKAEEIGGSTVRPPCPVWKTPWGSPGELLRDLVELMPKYGLDILVETDSYKKREKRAIRNE